MMSESLVDVEVLPRRDHLALSFSALFLRHWRYSRHLRSRREGGRLCMQAWVSGQARAGEEKEREPGYPARPAIDVRRHAVSSRAFGLAARFSIEKGVSGFDRRHPITLSAVLVDQRIESCGLTRGGRLQVDEDEGQ